MIRARAALVLVALLASVATAQADPGADAIAKAQAAEARRDWQGALDHYERAHAVSGQAETLLNIALNVERLGRLRDAAAVLNRFLAASSSNLERARVKDKLITLRRTPATVRFTSTPSGQAVWLDDKELGTTPLEVEVEAGPHRALAIFSGSRTPAREIVVAFGESLTIDFRQGALPGRLRVAATARGARVFIDGRAMGVAPFDGSLPAGVHTVLVSAPGYRTVSRDLEVPQNAVETITAKLPAMGSPASGASGAAPSGIASLSYVLGFGFGVAGGSSEGATGRGVIEAGIRSPSARWELDAAIGSFGGAVGSGVGGVGRFYLGGQRLRPYVRGAVVVGKVGESDDERRTLGFEAGVGLRYGMVGRAGFAAEYFIEGNLQITSADKARDPGDEPLPALASTFLSFPVTLGIAIRFGGGKR